MENQEEESSGLPGMGNLNTPEFEMWALMFMRDYFTEHPYATEEDMTTAMYEAYQNKIKSDLGDLIGDMIQEYVDIRSQMENPKEVKESDIEKATEQCPYFKSMHKALNYSNHFRGHIENYDWDRKGQASGQGPSTSSQGTTDAAQSANERVPTELDDCEDEMCFAFHRKRGGENHEKRSDQHHQLLQDLHKLKVEKHPDDKDVKP